ncbi:hypothetical protein J4217_01585 [Candidatus Pacearchaeota archaeon]|nr:hypothetical protein [Candidatus Pacearchaeota archaeon]
MAIKTFNIDKQVHKDYSAYCKKEGISMSKKIENFIKSELEKIKNKKETSEKMTKHHTSSEKDAHPDNHDNSFSKYC